jgi:hypothetical protein
MRLNPRERTARYASGLAAFPEDFSDPDREGIAAVDGSCRIGLLEFAAGREFGREVFRNRRGLDIVPDAVDDVLSKACGKFPTELGQGIYLAGQGWSDPAGICGSTPRVSKD